jgi:protein-S-isoprenylcysteine O-methyltransferase Ste14
MTRADPHGAAWWRGVRGEWLVVAQFAVMFLVFLGPRSLPRSPDTPLFSTGMAWWAGATLMLAGSALSIAGGLLLGSALTPLPYPNDDGRLAQSGPFRIVRHPMYAGLLTVSVGAALLTVGWLPWLYAAVLFPLLDVKSRREERWLCEKFPEYPGYQRRVRKLIPFVY